MTEKNKSIRNFPNSGNIPKLRFSEFTEEWEENQLESYIDVISGVALKSDEISDEKKGIPILRGINITEGFIRHTNEIDRFYSKELNRKTQKYILELDDLVIGMDGSKVGKNVAMIREKDVGSILIQRVARIKALGSTNIHFIFQKIFSNEFVKYVDLVNTSSGIPHISLQQIKDFKTSFPATLEQEKIASFLTLLDKRIQTQKKIIEVLQTYKLSLSDKIFTKKIRFKDSNDENFPEWRYKTLGEIGEIINGLTYNPNDVNDSGVLVLRSSNVQKRTVVLKDNVFVKTANFNAVKENDILICVRNGSKNLIGKNVIIKKENEGLAFGAFMSVYRSAYNKFIYQWFDTMEYKEIVKKNLGATINSINGSDLKKFKIPFPSANEQNKIASFFESLDDKISLENELLTQYENQKKYLLRNLFV